MYFNVAMLQLLPGSSQEENLRKGIEYCRKAKAMGADLALFPEMWNTGYSIPADPEELNRAAVETNGEFVSAFAALAAELEMAVAVTYLQSYSPAPRNTVSVIDRTGKIILTYAKVHTCDFCDERVLTPGDGFYTAILDTSSGPVKIGAMICYDREFPESARVLMLEGAEVILVPNACPLELNRLAQLRARAYENMLGIATVNYAFGMPDCNGHSSAYDGIAFGECCPGVSGWRDMLIVEAGEAEGIYMAAFPIDKIREYRGREIHGNAYRRPSKYRLLTEEKIEPPFIRSDRRN